MFSDFPENVTETWKFLLTRTDVPDPRTSGTRTSTTQTPSQSLGAETSTEAFPGESAEHQRAGNFVKTESVTWTEGFALAGTATR